MIPFAAAVEKCLKMLAEDALRQLEGLPSDDLNDWRPREDLEDINTFFALATHLVGSGEHWVLHGAGGRPVDRDRPAEFRARGSLDDVRARYDRWLAGCHEVLAGITEPDLAHDSHLPEQDRRFPTVADCLIHAVEHTATHVGHLHIQRQLWNAEQAG
ncbi:MAG: DinB family protein [Thermomicrobiales bacterium]